MPSCLGIYIEKNIIKYAKVSSEKESIKIDAFGVKFYDRLNEAMEQIMSETDSYSIPVSVNLSNESYQYFNILAILKGKDIEEVIKTEFESYCYDEKLNPHAFETRHTLANSLEEKDKIRVINISDNKIDISSKVQLFDKYKLSTLTPISVSIKNILNIQERENSLIVNIEDKTTITTLINQRIYNVTTLENGMGDVLEYIANKENSYSKAYEICKNTTVVTSATQEINELDNPYINEIMNAIYNIAGQVKKIINESSAKIDKIYLTGTAAVINNLDLYFQEYLAKENCEIIKPYFIKTVMKGVNIKDYIEVNTAISLAMQGLGFGLENMNFKKNNLKDIINNKTKITIGKNKVASKNNKEESKKKLKNIIQLKWVSEFNLIATAIKIVLAFAAYITVIVVLSNETFTKQNATNELIANTNKEILSIQNDTTKAHNKSIEYKQLIANLEEINNEANEIAKRKNAIPNLLNEIMFGIPDTVQVMSINNTSDTHIVIVTKTEKYEQIGMFIAKLKNDEILKNVIADSGVKENGVITVTIEGDLP